MKKLLLVLAVISNFSLFAQNTAPCGTNEFMNDMLRNNPELLKARDQFYDDVSREITATDKQYKKGTVRVIPVVFHIIHAYGDENISKDQVLDQVRILNEDFRRLNKDTVNTRSIFKARAADTEIEFKLARKDPNGNCTDGITRTYSTLTDGGDEDVKNLIKWDYRKYLNIWVIKRIGRSPDSGGTILGYAYLPYTTNAAVDGIVMISSRIGSIGTSSPGNAGRTLTHEVGHWLGLIHPFDNGCGSNCSSTGDRICDTPPVFDPSYGCPTTNNTCNNDAPNELDMVENFMDYANGSCQNAFTKGQSNVMNSVCNNNAYRGLNVSTANMTATGVLTNPNCGPKSDFHTTTTRTVVCQGGSISFTDLSYNGDVTDRKWTFEGGSPSISTFASPTVTYNSAGTFKVTYEVSNADGTNSLTKDAFITVIPAQANIKTPYTESFENASQVAIDWRIGEIGTYGWRRTSTVAFSGSASIQGYIDANTAANTRYNLYSSALDMTTLGISNPIFSFKAAYSIADATKSELLILHASTDCGNTWKTVAGYRSNTGLTSVTGVNSNWSPKNAGEWKTQTADLSAYANVSNLMLRFELVSQSGNSVFIDNINISRYATGVQQILSEENFDVFPNPAVNSLKITLNLPSRDQVSLKIYNSMGLVVADLSDQAQRLDELVLEELSSGIYYVKIENGIFGATRKVLVLNKP
jgi:PKD repeat protein